jgi:hypothetical protein
MSKYSLSEKEQQETKNINQKRLKIYRKKANKFIINKTNLDLRYLEI